MPLSIRTADSSRRSFGKMGVDCDGLLSELDTLIRASAEGLRRQR